jgi:hypothetical protein
VRASIDLRRDPKVREFIAQYPALKTPFENGNHQVTCAIVAAELNAKLIHVKTGEIVWIGSHELHEYNAGMQQVSVEVGQRTYVANAKELRAFVEQQNNPYMRQVRYGRLVQVPEPVMRTDLIAPMVSSGRCEKDWKADDETRSQLARKVARDLISTIRSGS